VNIPAQEKPDAITFTGDVKIAGSASLLDFWRWAFSDLCDDDIKGIFAEWMVGMLLGLPLSFSRRVSWADSDIILLNGTRIEVKATALWQSWKLVNQDGSSKSITAPATLNPGKIRFCGLQARTTESQWSGERAYKADLYVFCFHSQTDPAEWDAWNLADWEFYVMTRQELADLKVGRSISLTALRKIRQPMSAAQFQSHMQALTSR
jgi:hypothetical protein